MFKQIGEGGRDEGEPGKGRVGMAVVRLREGDKREDDEEERRIEKRKYLDRG